MYVYFQTEHGEFYNLYTVGFYTPTNEWKPESDWSMKENAAKRVAWLNGCGESEWKEAVPEPL